MAKRTKTYTEIIRALKQYDTKTEAMEAVGLSRSRFYNYLNLMKSEGVLDSHYEMTAEYLACPDRFNK